MRPRLVVLASMLAALVAVAVPGSAAAAPKHNHGLTIAASPNPIIAGEGVVIYGRLKGPDAGGQTIRLYHHLADTPGFTFVGKTTTDPGGFYEFTREEGVVYTNRSWFVRGPDGSHSRTVHERVLALVSLFADTLTQDTNHPIVFTGHVTPNHAFERVLLQQQNGTGDDWNTLKVGRLGGGSNYRIVYRWRTPGAHDVRVVFPGDARNVTGVSDSLTVTIQQAQVKDFTINTSQPIITIGDSATISGTLFMRGTTTPEPNTPVTLCDRTASQPTFSCNSATFTGADGGYHFTVSPAQNTWYLVRTTLPPKRHTALLFEGVRDMVTMTPSSMSATVGQTVTFIGTVTPDKAGHPIYLQRLGVDGDWHTVEVRFVKFDSSYKFSWTFGNPGAKEFRVRIPSDPANVGAASAPATINVTLPPVASLPSGS